MEKWDRYLKELYKILQGQRIAGIDFGLKRLGIAYTDELHITITTKGFLDYTSVDFWENLKKVLDELRITAVVVGMPYRKNLGENPFIEEVQKFIKEFKDRMGIEPIVYDEAFSSKRAVQTMIEIGIKKKKRAEKGRVDSVSAGIILRDFLNELELYKE